MLAAQSFAKSLSHTAWRGVVGRTERRVNAFGNALGESVASSMQSGYNTPAGGEAADYRNGMDVDSDNATAQRDWFAGMSPRLGGYSGDAAAPIAGSAEEGSARAQQLARIARMANDPSAIGSPASFRVEVGGTLLGADLQAYNQVTVDMASRNGESLAPTRVNAERLGLFPLGARTGADLMDDGRASASDYWSAVQDAGAQDGSFLKYAAGGTMRTLASAGYFIKDAAVGAWNDPADLWHGARKAFVNFGPEVFNGAVTLTKASLNGWSLIAEQLGADDGTFAGFRASDPYNIPLLSPYANKAQSLTSMLTNAATGVGLAKYGGYGLAIDDVGSLGNLSQRGAVGLRLVGPAESAPWVDFSRVDGVSPGFYRADPRQLRFTQPTASPNFSNGGTIDSLVADLRAGRVRPDQVGDPLRVVLVEGRPFSFDNRRLVSFNAAGVDNVPIQVMGLEDAAFASRFRQRFNPILGEGQQVVIAKSADQKAAQQLLYRLGLTNRP